MTLRCALSVARNYLDHATHGCIIRCFTSCDSYLTSVSAVAGADGKCDVAAGPSSTKARLCSMGLVSFSVRKSMLAVVSSGISDSNVSENLLGYGIGIKEFRT